MPSSNDFDLHRNYLLNSKDRIYLKVIFHCYLLETSKSVTKGLSICDGRVVHFKYAPRSKKNQQSGLQLISTPAKQDNIQ